MSTIGTFFRSFHAIAVAVEERFQGQCIEQFFYPDNPILIVNTPCIPECSFSRRGVISSLLFALKSRKSNGRVCQGILWLLLWVLPGIPDLTAESPEGILTGVFVNQAGYEPTEAKHFVTDRGEQEFAVVDATTERVVYRGITTLRRAQDPATGMDLWWGDFSALREPGDYWIVLEDAGRSHVFTIAQGVYADVAQKALKSFYYQRCGVPLESAFAGKFARDACHLHDADYHASLGRVGGKPTSGGWHDAGDYGKYIHAAAVSLAHMLIMYEQFPDAFSSDVTGIPESGNGVPDFLDEMQWELDWMLRMQESEPEHPEFGGVHYMVNTFEYEWMRADLDQAPRYLYAVSSVATADFAAVMALASRCFRGTPEWHETAERYLDAARRAWDFLERHPELYPNGGFIRPADTKTGGYADRPDLNDRDDRMWAAVELFLATGDAVYADVLRNPSDAYVQETLWSADALERDLEWQNVSAFAQLQCALHDVTGIDPGLDSRWSRFLIERCERIVGDVASDGFAVALTRYYWGSNGGAMALAQYLLLAYKLDSTQESFREAALAQLHYLLGRNAHNLSFVTAVGSRSPLYIHHASLAPGGDGHMYPGLLAGGPNPGLSGDQTLPLHFDEHTPPALCYLDHIDSWASNENCILYNAPLVAVAHYFAAPD